MGVPRWVSMDEQNKSRGLISMRSMSSSSWEFIAGVDRVFLLFVVAVRDGGLFSSASSEERLVAISRNRACILIVLFLLSQASVGSQHCYRGSRNRMAWYSTQLLFRSD